MKVSNVGSAKGTSRAGKKKALSGTNGDFADQLREAAGTAAPAAPVESQAPGTVEAILSVQEVPDSTAERSRGLVRRYGDNLLERLEDLRRQILLGTLSKDKLAELARMLRYERGRSDDPHLNRIIDEIELRARVEIAKFTRNV